jgi:hypothetical protein
MDTSGLNSGLVSRLGRVRAEVAAAASRSGVEPADVTLVAVSKGRSSNDLLVVADAGQRIFGENRQQGLAERVHTDFPSGVQWHFIGPLQSRKSRFVAAHVSLLHSMDRFSLMAKWASAGSTPVLLQFNMGDEPQKSGFSPDDAGRALDAALDAGLDVRGVMAIPPLAQNPEATRPYYSKLRSIFDRYREHHSLITDCSMGMSNDFAVAIEEGSTMVRVGRAIFEPTSP